MVAVVNPRPSHRPAGPSPRRFEVVPELVEVDRGRLSPGAGRCGCRRHRSSSAGARGLSVVHAEAAGCRLPASTYRRRRLVAALVATGLVVAAWVALGALGGALTASGRSAPDLGSRASAVVVEVAPGDTLWTIARRLQPSGDVRPLVDRLATARGGAVLQVGERIQVPARR